MAQFLSDVCEAGMEIGNHTFNHPRLDLYAQAGASELIKEEIKRTHEAIQDLVGFSMRLFRLPWGRINDPLKSILEQDPIASINYNGKVIGWNIDSDDWQTNDADKIFENVAKSANLDGAIVLMHDGADRLYQLCAAPTVKASRRLIPWLTDKGYKLVTVSELLG